MSFWSLSNPARFTKLSTKMLPTISIVAASFLITGLLWGVFFTPPDYRQGEAIKIIFVHVPSAFLAVNIYFMMFISSIIWLVRRHHVSALAAKAAAPIGLSMTLIALVTGGLWGQPIWGTFWVWDPRLTSFAIMASFYIGYIALWRAVSNKDQAADLTSMLCLVGSVFAILSRYAVLFWSQGLHQGATLSLDKEKNIATVFFIPLIISMIGFTLLFITLVLLRTQTEIKLRRIESLSKIGRSQ